MCSIHVAPLREEVAEGYASVGDVAMVEAGAGRAKGDVHRTPRGGRRDPRCTRGRRRRVRPFGPVDSAPLDATQASVASIGCAVNRVGRWRLRSVARDADGLRAATASDVRSDLDAANSDDA